MKARTRNNDKGRALQCDVGVLYRSQRKHIVFTMPLQVTSFKLQFVSFFRRTGQQINQLLATTIMCSAHMLHTPANEPQQE